MIINLCRAASNTVRITPAIVFNDELSILRFLCERRIRVILCEGGRQEETLSGVELLIKVKVTFFYRCQDVDV